MVDYVWEILDVSPSGDNLPDGGQKLINNWAVVSSTLTIDDTTFDLTLGADLTVIGTLSASAVAITGGTISGIADLALADGGTGSSTAAGARANLVVDQAGTDNSTDVTLAGAPNYITIVGQVITRALINLATHVTGLLPLANGGTNASTAAAARTNLGVVVGTDVQAWDADLDTYAAAPLTAAELGELQNIDAVTISNAQWVFVGAFDQGLTTTSNVSFGTITASGVLSVDDTTESTSTTTGSIHTDGGLGVAKTIVAGTGISLGGTAPANLLDDYEEGTFTPVIADAVSGGNVATASTAAGAYTKVGNLVKCGLRFNNIDTTGLTAGNILFVRNFPFVSKAGTVRHYGTVTTADFITFSGCLSLRIGPSGAEGILFDNTSGAAAGMLLISALSSGVSDMELEISYLT